MAGHLFSILIIKIFISGLTIFASLVFLISCSTLSQTISPSEKPATPRLTYEELIKEDYRGPKARVLLKKFMDQTSSAKESSQLGEGMAEMLGNALLSTNRFIVMMRKSYDLTQKRPETEAGDLFIEGAIKEFHPGIPGAGERTGGTSSLQLLVTIIDPQKEHVLASEKVVSKASDFGETPKKAGGELPTIFKDFSKTPMEKAIRKAIEDSVSFIVAKIPLDYYRVLPPAPPPPPQTLPPEPPKATVTPEVSIPPPPPLLVTPKPTLPTTHVIWSSVNLREGPGGSYKVIGNIKKGTTLTVLEEKGDWLRVCLDDGREAWVFKSATSMAPPKPTPSKTSDKPKPM